MLDLEQIQTKSGFKNININSFFSDTEKGMDHNSRLH